MEKYEALDMEVIIFENNDVMENMGESMEL